MYFSHPNMSSRRLNLGCGFDVRPDYLNVDLHASHAPDLVADVTQLGMLPPGHFEFVVAQDVLEHLERDKVQLALDEWARLMAQNGVIHIRVPSLEHLLKMLCRPENRPAEKAAEIIHLLYGTQAYGGDYHLSGFTASVLRAHLERAGLMVCGGRIRDDWLFDVEARKCAVLADDAEFVHHAYFKTLGRFADADGHAHYSAALASGQLAREDFVRSLTESQEAELLRTQPSYLL